MATLDNTVGGPSSNSYVDVAEADAYFESRVHSASWENSDTKEALLISASAMLDWFLKYKGSVATSTQSMKWPRVDVVLPDSSSVDSDVIPNPIKVATFEMALAIVDEDISLDSDLAGLSHVQAGQLVIKTNSNVRPNQKGNIPSRIKSIVRELVVNSGISVRRVGRA